MPPLIIYFLQQCLIERKILFRKGEGEIDQAERRHVMFALAGRDVSVIHGTLRPLP